MWKRIGFCYDVSMTTKEALEIIWDYLNINETPSACDALLVLGSYDMEVPKYAATLYHSGVAPIIVCSGSGTVHTGDPLWIEFKGVPEAEIFAHILKESGVPDSALLIENRSQNTGDNFIFTRALLAEKNILPKSITIVTKPYMTRRALATAQKVWPEISWSVASEGGNFETHLIRNTHKDRIIELMVGDLDRIIKYPDRGFQLTQEVPDTVMAAYEILIQNGYTRCLV